MLRGFPRVWAAGSQGFGVSGGEVDLGEGGLAAVDQVAAAGDHRHGAATGQLRAEQLAVVVDVGDEQHDDAGLAQRTGPVVVALAEGGGATGGREVTVAPAEQLGPGDVKNLGRGKAGNAL